MSKQPEWVDASVNTEYYDVIIVGAGLSGIGAAAHLERECPGKRYLILEGRERMGGTWDLFRYPGIRSDSDMHTLGYDFKPSRTEPPSSITSARRPPSTTSTHTYATGIG